MYEIQDGTTEAFNKIEQRLNARDFPLEKIKPGQFFFVPSADLPSERVLRNFRILCLQHGKKKGKKFAIRKAEGGYKVFRRI